ncbi:MAG: DUF1501 domain-containing protein [Thermoguttaceae bacterium]
MSEDLNPANCILSRRQLLSRCGMGMGSLALTDILGRSEMLSAAEPSVTGGLQHSVNPMAPKRPMFPGKAKRVIHLFMNGGPSQVDTFDPKPMLAQYVGKSLPMPPFKFQKYGKSGIEVSDLFAKTARNIDDICIIRSMYADVPNHEPSLMLMNCGEARLVRPSMGSWITYGLGTENQNLPGFVVMCPDGYPIQESQNWQAGFLPGAFQGTYIDTANTDVQKLIENVNNRAATLDEQHRQLDLLAELNAAHARMRGNDVQLENRIESFELAYRMQTEATDAFDVDREPQRIMGMYGPGKQARQILIARRLIERGVRFVQVWHGAGQPWDSHDDLEVQHRALAGQCDQAISALLTDLKQRGMLDDTLVIWGGEFGRTPVVELPVPGQNAGKINGRDHNHYGFTMWMAGGGVKGGYVHGATDEFGFRAVQDPVHVHDLHATILHLLGYDHEKYTYRYAGRDFRLTDVHGKVVRQILA